MIPIVLDHTARYKGGKGPLYLILQQKRGWHRSERSSDELAVIPDAYGPLSASFFAFRIRATLLLRDGVSLSILFSDFPLHRKY